MIGRECSKEAVGLSAVIGLIQRICPQRVERIVGGFTGWSLVKWTLLRMFMRIWNNVEEVLQELVLFFRIQNWGQKYGGQIVRGADARRQNRGNVCRRPSFAGGTEVTGLKPVTVGRGVDLHFHWRGRFIDGKFLLKLQNCIFTNLRRRCRFFLPHRNLILIVVER